MQKTINEKVVAALPTPETGNRVFYFSGATLGGRKAPSGFGVRVTANGARSFVLFQRVDGRKYLHTLGRVGDGGGLSVREAMIKAVETVKGINSGRRDDPRPERTRRLEDGNQPEGLTVGGMLDTWLERYCRKEAKLRSADEIGRVLEKLIKPAIGHLPVSDVRRSHVVKMLDEIADENGARAADLSLAYIRKCFNWYAARDDQFIPPVVKGMSRTKSRERARSRILDDGEVRDLWKALGALPGVPDCYGRYIKFLLLTATRRDEAAEMHSSELDGGVWTIPASRYKGKRDHVVPLSKQVRALIGNPLPGYIFSSTNGEKNGEVADVESRCARRRCGTLFRSRSLWG